MARTTVVDLEKREIRHQFIGALHKVAVADDGAHVVAAATPWSIKVLAMNANGRAPGLVRTWPTSSAIQDLVMHPAQPSVVAILTDQAVLFHDWTTGERVQTVPLHAPAAWKMAWSSDGTRFAVHTSQRGSSDRDTTVFDSSSGAVVLPSVRGAGYLAPDGKTCALIRDTRVVVVDVDSGAVLGNVGPYVADDIAIASFVRASGAIVSKANVTLEVLAGAPCEHRWLVQFDVSTGKATSQPRVFARAFDEYNAPVLDTTSFFHECRADGSKGDICYVAPRRVLFFDPVHGIARAHVDATAAIDHVAHASESPNGRWLVMASRDPQAPPRSTSPPPPQDDSAKTTATAGGDASDLAPEMDRILRDAVVNRSMTAPVAVAFSSRSLSSALRGELRGGLVPDFFPIDGAPGTSIMVCNGMASPAFSVKTAERLLHLKMPVNLYVVRDHPAEPLILARIALTLDIDTTLQYAVGADGPTFQILLKGVDDPQTFTKIVYPAEAVGPFGSIGAVNKAMEEAVSAIVDRTLPGIGNLIPAVLSVTPMPTMWNRSEDYALEFRGFQYERIAITQGGDDYHQDYVVVLFSAFAKKAAPRCFCPRVPGATQAAASENALLPLQHPASTMDIRHLGAIAFSQEALQVIMAPHVRGGKEDEDRIGGSLFARVSSWVRYELYQKVKVEKHGLSMRVDTVEAGGGVDIGMTALGVERSAGLGVNLAVEEFDVNWGIELYHEDLGDNLRQSHLLLRPRFSLGPKNVRVDFEGPFPWWAKKLTSAVAEWFAGSLATMITFLLNFLGVLDISQSVVDERDGEGYSFVEPKTVSVVDSSMTIVGWLVYHRAFLWHAKHPGADVELSLEGLMAEAR